MGQSRPQHSFLPASMPPLLYPNIDWLARHARLSKNNVSMTRATKASEPAKQQQQQKNFSLFLFLFLTPPFLFLFFFTIFNSFQLVCFFFFFLVWPFIFPPCTEHQTSVHVTKPNFFSCRLLTALLYLLLATLFD